MNKTYTGILLLLLCILTLYGCRPATQTDFDDYESRETEETKEIMEYAGHRYVPKKNIETYLLMGIDSKGKPEKVNDYGESGMCDVLFLVVRDISAGTWQILEIDRNTMTEVKSLDLDGTYLATTVNQIAYAHAEGDGLHISCKNTADAVARFLGNRKIDGYAAIHMEAIKSINALAGGITVTIEDDFSRVDPTLRIGEQVTLSDEQAFHYVQSRLGVGDGSNENRIRRQSIYLKALTERFRERYQEDETFALDVYKALEEYMVTDIPLKKFRKLASAAVSERDGETLRIEGETQEDEYGYIEFWPDKDSLQEIIVTLFYKLYE